MPDKINLAVFSRNLGSGGPIKHVRNILKYIDRTKFEPFLVTTITGSPDYAPEVRSQIPEANILDIPDSHFGWRQGSEYEPAPNESPLYDWIANKGIHVLLAERNGERQFPLNADKIRCKKADINIFGGHDVSPDLGRSFCISKGVYNVWKRKMETAAPNRIRIGKIGYLSTDYPATTEDMRKELGIPESTIVFGRISNRWVADHVNLEAYKRVEDDNTLFLCPAFTQHHINWATRLGIKNIKFLDVIGGTMQNMSRLINTMDVICHHRSESFGCAVAEAIFHKRPVVTVGWSNGDYNDYNAHEELIQDPAYCSKTHDPVQEYADILKRLKTYGREYCVKEGTEMLNRLSRTHSVQVVIPALERDLIKLVSER